MYIHGNSCSSQGEIWWGRPDLWSAYHCKFHLDRYIVPPLQGRKTESLLLNNSLLSNCPEDNPAGKYITHQCIDSLVVIRESTVAAVSDEKSAAATAAGPATGSQSVDDRPEDMPSFDEWKQKEQEKTKNSEGQFHPFLFTLYCFAVRYCFYRASYALAVYAMVVCLCVCLSKSESVSYTHLTLPTNREV